ncbi:MAG TPA: hypothetical protein VE176_08915, partial [Candidatus Limnocylindrales bacterium]|nr:hypothetical protein [Candidatus Limnocylindrales bacterium]
MDVRWALFRANLRANRLTCAFANDRRIERSNQNNQEKMKNKLIGDSLTVLAMSVALMCAVATGQ